MAKQRQLVSQYLESISGTALDKYQRIIREYVRRRHGIYALYRRDRLYYVGLASNLRNRLNVAISRAQCVAVLVCSPRLLEARCRSIEEMELVNALCRLVEYADRYAG